MTCKRADAFLSIQFGIRQKGVGIAASIFSAISVTVHLHCLRFRHCVRAMHRLCRPWHRMFVHDADHAKLPATLSCRIYMNQELVNDLKSTAHLLHTLCACFMPCGTRKRRRGCSHPAKHAFS